VARKSLPPLREVADDYIAALWKIHDDPRCDASSKKHLRTLARDLTGMSCIVDKVLEDFGVQPQSRMGRHAPLPEREGQLWLDFQCYQRCHEFHDRPPGMSFDEAYVEVGKEFHLGPDAVKIRRFKVERMLKEQMVKGGRTWRENI
jgi:hypothetical protein